VLRQAGGGLLHGRRRRAPTGGRAARAPDRSLPVSRAGRACAGGAVAGGGGQRVRGQTGQTSQISQTNQ
jgi:hypothetical protein